MFLGSPVQVPPAQAEVLVAAQAQIAAQTMICIFNFLKRLCFHLKRCCLLLFDPNKVKDNRTQMKYISTLILHSLALLPGAVAGADPVAIRCTPGSE